MRLSSLLWVLAAACTPAGEPVSGTPTPPIGPTEPLPAAAMRDSVAIELTPTDVQATATSHPGEQRWTNVGACSFPDRLCLGVPGGDPAALKPDVPLTQRPTDTVVSGVVLEPGFGGECAPTHDLARFPLPAEPITVRTADGDAPLPALVPLVALEAPTVDGQLSLRWEPAGQPMALHLIPTSGPQLPVVIPVDDTGALDLPFAQLGLHPDILSAHVTLERGFFGTFDGDRPLDWSLTSAMRQHVELGGDRQRVDPEASCSDAVSIPAGRHWFPSATSGFVAVDTVPEGQVLRIRHEGALTLRDACGGVVLNSVSDGEDLLIPAGVAPVLEAHDGSDLPTHLDLVLEPVIALSAFADTCAEAIDPVPNGLYRVDTRNFANARPPGCTTALASSPETMFPVMVPAGHILTVHSAGAAAIALQDDCSLADACLAETSRRALTWQNTGTTDATVVVAVEWEGFKGLTDLWVAIEQPLPRAPTNDCSGPLIDGFTASGSLAGLSAPDESCSWPDQPQPVGTYRIALDAGERLHVDANWSSGRFGLLEQCDDPSSIVASGWSNGPTTEPLVFENAGGPRTYTLRLQGDPSPFALRVGR